MRDWLRRRKADPSAGAVAVDRMKEEVGGILGEPAEADFQPLLEAALDQQASFSLADVSRIEHWQPWDRVVLLCRSHLWSKVSPAKWNAWLGECGVAPPFPPAEFSFASEREWNAILSRALGTKRNTMAQRWLRGRRLLRDLDYLRDMHHDR